MNHNQASKVAAISLPLVLALAGCTKDSIELPTIDVPGNASSSNEAPKARLGEDTCASIGKIVTTLGAEGKSFFEKVQKDTSLDEDLKALSDDIRDTLQAKSDGGIVPDKTAASAAEAVAAANDALAAAIEEFQPLLADAGDDPAVNWVGKNIDVLVGEAREQAVNVKDSFCEAIDEPR